MLRVVPDSSVMRTICKRYLQGQLVITGHIFFNLAGEKNTPGVPQRFIFGQLQALHDIRQRKAKPDKPIHNFARREIGFDRLFKLLSQKLKIHFDF